MTLDSAKRYINDHRPDISNPQKYPHEKRRSDDETKEKDTRQVKNDPYSAVDAYDVVKIFQELRLLGQYWRDNLGHVFILSDL